MNKGFIFVFISGLILGALIVLLNIIELRREEILILSSGVLSLVGGAFGAIGAYFIAKKQIKKQESMKKSDLKLDKFIPVLKKMKIVKCEMGKIFNMFEYYYRGGCSEEELITFLEGSKHKTNGYWREIENEHLYLEMIFKDENELASIKLSTISFYMDDIKDLKSKMTDYYRPLYQTIKFKKINEAIEKLEKEVKNILLN